jgi:hypothetical protein
MTKKTKLEQILDGDRIRRAKAQLESARRCGALGLELGACEQAVWDAEEEREQALAALDEAIAMLDAHIAKYPEEDEEE